MTKDPSEVERHYGRGDLRSAILDALAAAGKDPQRLGIEDLAPFDELHVRGRDATLELAALAGIQSHTNVLDLGCGIGGPARVLASAFGCHVTGLDLNEAYCQVAGMLAEMVGLAHLVRYRQGDALAMPFDDGTFDLVWTQHAAMNIADKAALYREVRRVLKPNGRLALYDLLAGPGGAPHYPVPWARESSISFLATPAALEMVLAAAGLEVLSVRDKTDAGLRWFEVRDARGDLPAGPDVLLGPDFPAMLGNLRRNLEERRVVAVQALCRRP